MSAGKDIMIKPTSTPQNDPKYAGARYIDPRIEWKVTPP